MLEPVEIFTDGSSHGNPGPGGWGAILSINGHRKELSGGFRRTTNNRMEILAAIMGLESLKRPCRVTLYTDSRYLCDAVEKNWLGNWLKNGWKTAGKKPVKNKDLWLRLLPLLKEHEVAFRWVKGHAGHPENERCDVLANIEADRPGQPEDAGMES